MSLWSDKSALWTEKKQNDTCSSFCKASYVWRQLSVTGVVEIAAGPQMFPRDPWTSSWRAPAVLVKSQKAFYQAGRLKKDSHPRSSPLPPPSWPTLCPSCSSLPSTHPTPHAPTHKADRRPISRQKPNPGPSLKPSQGPHPRWGRPTQ